MMMHLKPAPLTRKIIFFILASMMLSAVHAQAALNQNEVSMLYVSIFNRASEGGGNTYWGNRSDLQTMAAVASAMLDTDAARNYFGASLNSNQAFIQHIYLNTLNKTITDDPDGIAYWVGQLESGKTRGEVVAAMVGVIKDYAPGGPYYNPNDPVTIAAYNQFTNRVTISNYMAGLIQDPPANWQTATQFGPGGLNVTFEGTTVDTAKQTIDMFASNAGGLADDIHYYMAMITSAGELTPMMDEIGILLETILNGDPSVVSITPALQTIDLNNPPSNISIDANFGSGYTPPNTSALYTGRILIDITGISFTQTGINAIATLNASNVQRNGEPILNGIMTLSVNAGMSGNNTSVTANVNFSNISSMGIQTNGGITLNIPAISGEGQLLQPVTLTLNQFSTQDYLLNGTVNVAQISAETYDITFNVTTSQGPVTGVLRAQMNPVNMDQTILSTPSGGLTVGTASLVFNQVVMDSYLCADEGLPASGNIVVTRGQETATISFNNCGYTVN
jgi:hypothetical protein